MARDSGAAAAVVSTPALARRLMPAVMAARTCRLVVAMALPEVDQAPAFDLVSWDEMLTAGAAAPDELARRYGARLTPTVLFLDGRGRELTKPMIGINTVEFYGYYLDAAIDTARQHLPARHPPSIRHLAIGDTPR